MKTYQVDYTVREYGWIQVEAESAEDAAKEIADTLSGEIIILEAFALDGSEFYQYDA